MSFPPKNGPVQQPWTTTSPLSLSLSLLLSKVWQDGAWVKDPRLRVTEGPASGFPRFITFAGHSGPQVGGGLAWGAGQLE